MEDRLLRLLDAEQISSSRFAEVIGVQRSSVSHILSGRNKPSYDFLQKILQAFPMISPDWLLLGKGPMYKGEQNPAGGTLFDTPVAVKSAETGTNTQLQDLAEEQRDPVPDKGSIESKVEDDLPGAIVNRKTGEGEIPGNMREKRIARVIIFYSDHTFDVYNEGQV